MSCVNYELLLTICGHFMATVSPSWCGWFKQDILLKALQETGTNGFFSPFRQEHWDRNQKGRRQRTAQADAMEPGKAGCHLVRLTVVILSIHT